MAVEIVESFLDDRAPRICGVFWRDASRCPIGRSRLYNGGHVCANPSGHTREDGHWCKCSQVWIPA